MIGYGLEQFNALNGNVELNPSTFGLNMQDIANASDGLKAAVYSGNIELTAQYYQEMQKISEYKYSKILGPTIDPSGNLIDPSMVGEDPGLYIGNERMGYWSGTDWGLYLTNTGEAFFGSESLNKYMRWNGTELIINGGIIKTRETGSRLEMQQDYISFFNDLGDYIGSLFPILSGSGIAIGTDTDIMLPGNKAILWGGPDFGIYVESGKFYVVENGVVHLLFP